MGSVSVTKDENISRSGNRKIFLDTMLKVNNDSRHTVPNKNLIDDGKLQNQQEKDKVMNDEDIMIKLQVEKKQKEVEEIINRKKNEEHLKRLKFEENRITEENEKR